MSSNSPSQPPRSPFVLQIPPDDNRPRLTCSDCGWIHYENPRIVVAAIIRRGEEIMLCRRAIRPRYGFWTFPGGFMELGESPEDGARREVREEACAEVSIKQLMGIYAVPRIGQVHLVYLAELEGDTYSAGSESLDVQFFHPADRHFPESDLAFPVNHWALRDFRSLRGQPVGQPFVTQPQDLKDRMNPVDFHPNFAPPDTSPDTSPDT